MLEKFNMRNIYSIFKEATISLLHFRGDNGVFTLANRNSEKKDIHSLLHRSPLKIAKDFAFISEDTMQSSTELSVKNQILILMK